MIKTVYIVLERVQDRNGRIVFEDINGVYDNLKAASDSQFKGFEDSNGYITYCTIQSHRLRTKPKNKSL